MADGRRGGVLVGIMLGLAIRPWGQRGRYRWDVALALGLLPAAYFAYQYLTASEGWLPPRWYLIYVFEFTLRYQTVIAVMLGLAVIAGLTTRRPRERRID